jgi:hypothetical protein
MRKRSPAYSPPPPREVRCTLGAGEMFFKDGRRRGGRRRPDQPPADSALVEEGDVRGWSNGDQLARLF